MLRVRRAGALLRTRGEGGLLRTLGDGRLRLQMSAMAGPGAEAVWLELHDRLLGFIGRRVRSRDDAEDILQEVMLRIHRHSGDLAHTDRVAGWVYRIATNSIADHYRRPARRELPTGHAADVPDTDWTAPETSARPDAGQLRAELAGCLAPLTARLPRIYREALEITEFQEISQVEAAAQVGLSVSGMKARVQRGRRQLKELLLDCCQVELDGRGAVSAYRAKRGSCVSCAGG